ncbi:restriction endonuclease [Streptomyces sp. NPDC004166]
MGYDTYLEIGDKCTFMWRKHASELPRMLFSFDSLRIERKEDCEDENDQYAVKFCSTVEKSLDVLSNSGLGWSAAVSAYATIRVKRGQASGALMADLHSKGLAWTQVQEELERFGNGSPELDLLQLSALMKKQMDADSDSIILLEDLTDYETPPHAFSDVFRAYEEADKYSLVLKCEILRAVESLTYLKRDAPLLAWPLIICILLKSLPGDTPIEFDLSDDAAEFSMTDTKEDARSYAAEYWEDAGKALAGTAQSLARLFGVLSSFDGALSEEYWATRSVESLDRLHKLNEDPGSYTTKMRGDALEGLVESLLRMEGAGLAVVEKNFRTTEEEIDLLVSNNLREPFWASQGSPLMLIECKNWKKKVGVPELRVFESKLRDRGALCRIGIFVSLSGFAKTFLERLKTFQADGGIIFAVDGDDLAQMVNGKQKMTDWLRESGLKRALGG